MGFACSFLRLDEDKERVSFGVIQKFVCLMNKGSIKRRFDKYIHGIKPPHRPRILTGDALVYVDAIVNENCQKKTSVSYRQRMDIGRSSGTGTFIGH